MILGAYAVAVSNRRQAITPNGAVLLLDSNSWAGVSITPAQDELNNTDRYLRGGDFAVPIWADSDIYSWYSLYIKGNGNPAPSTTYGGESLQSGVVRHDGATGTVLRLQVGPDNPPAGSVEQIRITEYQSQGAAGVGGRTEPVFYSRRWLKFDEKTLTRAIATGSSNFYQIVEEFKCEPDFRFRVQLQYNGTKLIWVAHDDVLVNANAIHYGSNNTVDVVLAAESSALGWHKLETYINRPLGIYRCTVDGVDIINLNFGAGTDLYGASGNIMNFPMFLQIYADASNNFGSAGPMVMLCSDMEIWDGPPATAF